MPLLQFKNDFLKYSSNKHSDNGEDGIINEILRRIGTNIPNKYLCEFGAWDGKFASNTFKLIEENINYIGLYIEGDEIKYKDLLETCKQHKNIIPYLAFVDHDVKSKNSIDSILKINKFPEDFLLLSIDIDSYDYQIFESLNDFKPIIIIVEINSSISPLHEEYIHNNANYEGTSFLPMYQLGIKKGYRLVCHTGNMIFLRKDYFDYISKDPFNFQTDLFTFNPKWLYANNMIEYKKLYE